MKRKYCPLLAGWFDRSLKHPLLHSWKKLFCLITCLQSCKTISDNRNPTSEVLNSWRFTKTCLVWSETSRTTLLSFHPQRCYKHFWQLQSRLSIERFKFLSGKFLHSQFKLAFEIFKNVDTYYSRGNVGATSGQLCHRESRAWSAQRNVEKRALLTLCPAPYSPASRARKSSLATCQYKPTWSVMRVASSMDLALALACTSHSLPPATQHHLFQILQALYDVASVCKPNAW